MTSDEDKDPRTARLINTFSDEYLAKYGVRPICMGAKWTNMLKVLLKQHEEETIRDAMRTYITSEDNFIVERRHPFELFYTRFDSLLTGRSTRKVDEAADRFLGRFRR